MTQDIDVNDYKNFVFMNSSVRGPFIPSYLRVRPSFSKRHNFPFPGRQGLRSALCTRADARI